MTKINSKNIVPLLLFLLIFTFHLIINLGCSRHSFTHYDISKNKQNNVIIPNFDKHVFLAINLNSSGLESENSGVLLSEETNHHHHHLNISKSTNFITDISRISHTIPKNSLQSLNHDSNINFSTTTSNITFNTTEFNFTVRKIGPEQIMSLDIIKGIKKYGTESSKCLIYVDENYNDLTVNWTAIGEAFETIYSQLTNTFIPDTLSLSLDVDGNDQIILLYYDLGKNNVGGMVTIFDLLDESSINAYNEINPENNQPTIKKDILYLNVNLLSSNQETKNKTTIAHEFQHLISNHIKIAQSNGGTFTQFELWIEEGLAESAAHISDTNYTRSKNINIIHNSSDIANGEGFIYWNHKVENYALTYLFFQYLRIHSGLETDFYANIQKQTLRNYEVLERLFTNSKEAITFENLLLRFHIATIVNSNDPNSIYGFGKEHSEFKFERLPNVTITNSQVFPGGRLVKYLNNKDEYDSLNLNPSGDHIYYYYISGNE